MGLELEKQTHQPAIIRRMSFLHATAINRGPTNKSKQIEENKSNS